MAGKWDKPLFFVPRRMKGRRAASWHLVSLFHHYPWRDQCQTSLVLARTQAEPTVNRAKGPNASFHLVFVTLWAATELVTQWGLLRQAVLAQRQSFTLMSKCTVIVFQQPALLETRCKPRHSGGRSFAGNAYFQLGPPELWNCSLQARHDKLVRLVHYSAPLRLQFVVRWNRCNLGVGIKSISLPELLAAAGPSVEQSAYNFSSHSGVSHCRFCPTKSAL